MDLPKSERQTLVEAWAQTESLPEGWYVSPDPKPNRIRIRWKDPVFQNQFLLVELRVEDDQLTLVKDRRNRVKELLSRPRGYKREAQLFEALQQPSILKPSWFLKLKKSKPYADMRGIDGFAHCMVEKEKLKLPFQIKSNVEDRETYYKRHPLGIGIVEVIIVDRRDSVEVLQCKMFSLLGEVRSRMLKSGITVADMHERLGAYFRNVKAAR